MKKKNAKPQPTELQRFKINRVAAKILLRLKAETCLAMPGSISKEEWLECRDIISAEIAKVIAAAEVDSEGSLVQDGDRIQFSYGTPVIGVVAKVIQRGKSLIALTPRHSPKECSLRDLRKFNIDFRKV